MLFEYKGVQSRVVTRFNVQTANWMALLHAIPVKVMELDSVV